MTELFIVKWPQVVKNTYCSFSFVDEVAFQRNLFSSGKINVDSRQQETMKYSDVHYTRPPIKGLKYTDTSKAEEMPPSHEPKQAY